MSSIWNNSENRHIKKLLQSSAQENSSSNKHVTMTPTHSVTLVPKSAALHPFLLFSPNVTGAFFVRHKPLSVDQRSANTLAAATAAISIKDRLYSSKTICD